MMVQLLAGMFLGCIIASVVWVLLHKSARNKVDASRREREEIMRSLGELWIEIDKLIAANRKSNFESKGFRESFKSKIDGVNQLFRPNLHLFDVYYVKYTENLIAEYNRAVLKGEAPIDRLAVTADVELETNYSVVEHSASVTTPSVAAAEPSVDKTPVVQAAPETDFLSSDEQTERVASASGTAADLDIVVEEKDAPKAAEADLFGLPVVADDAAAPVEIRGAPRAKIDMPEEKTGPEGSFDFEAVKAPEQEFKPGMAVEKEPGAALPPVKAEPPVEEEVSFEKAADKSAKAPQDVHEVVFEADAAKKPATTQKADDPFNEEDFSMETLIDVDINTISPFLKKETAVQKPSKPEPEEHHLFEVSSEKETPAPEAASLEIVIASNAGHTKSPARKDAPPQTSHGDQKKNSGKPGIAEKAADDIPEETKLTRSDDMRGKEKKSRPAAPAEKEEDGEAVFELKTREQPSVVPPQPASGGVSPADIELFDKEEATITGDDVADKIAALEFAKPSSVVSPPVKKEKEKDAKNDKPAGVAIKPNAPKSAAPAPSTKSTAGTASKAKVHDDTITGDDVADKIDSFFGLFEK